MTTKNLSLLKNQKSVVLALWAAVVLLLAVPQSALAETHTVGPYTATSDNGWKTGFNNSASPYMSITTLNNDASIKNGGDRYLAPQGTSADKNNSYTGTVTFVPASGTYITHYSFNYFYSGTAETSTTGSHFCNKGEIKVDNVSKSQAYEGSGAISGDLSNSATISIAVTTPKTPKGSSGIFGIGAWSGKENKVGISDFSFDLKIPEVQQKNDLWEETDNSLTKIKTKNTNITKDYTYNVADYKDKNDFEVTLTKPKGSGGGAGTATIQSVSDGVLTVRFSYTSANTSSWQEDYSYDLLVKSKNTVNTQSFTTHINGSATDQKSANTLAFLISANQKVNTQYTKEQAVSSNNTVKSILLSSDNTDVAYFDDYDELHIVGEGTAILTAQQDASDEIAAKTTTFTINVTKRQVEVAYTPAGALYTGKVYPNYVTVTNNATGTFPGLSYSLNTNSFIDINPAATVTTKQSVGSTTLTMTSDATTEWAATNINKTVEVVKDPASLDICLTQDVYKDFIKETSFCQKVTPDGTIFVTDDNKLCVGEANDRTVFTSTFEIHFIGIPQDMSFTYTRPTDGFFEGGGWFGLDAATKDYTLTIEAGNETGSSWTTLYTKSASEATSATTVNKDLTSTTRRIRITYTGVRYVYFSSFCINAKKDFTIPASVAITQSASGFMPETFDLEHSMMKTISVTSSNPHFVVTPSVLNNTHGLGYGNGTVQLKVSYTGSDISETATLTFSGTDVNDNVLANKTMTVSLVHPNHYVQGIANVKTGWGKVHIATDATEPDASAYVGGGSAGVGATMSTAVLNCGATGEGDTKTFTLRAMPDNTWQFAEWQDQAGNFLSGDNPYVANATALSTDAAHPTQYTYKAIFFKGFAYAPEFGVADLDMGYTFSGGQIIDNLPFTSPRYIERDKVTVTFVDVAGHTGESAVFSQNGQYNTGAQAVSIRFLPTGAHVTTRVYQAKAIVTAKNTEYDENGDPLPELRETVHECIVTATCYPAETAVFSVPDVLDFGAPITNEQLNQTHDLTLTDMVNVYGTPSISLNNAYFTADPYNPTTHSFTIHYNTANVTEGVLTTTATITCRNADNVATEHTTTIKIFIGKPDFTLADLNLGTTTSGGDNLFGYLELESANGIDVTQVTIAITDKAGHAGESQYFSFLTENPEWEGEEDTEHDQYISTWNPSDLTYHITFVPSASTPVTKTYEATVTITATNAKGTTTKSATLSAIVTPAGAASFTLPSSHTYNSVQRNVTDSWNVVPTNMQNIEGAPDVSITGANAAYFNYAGYDEGSHTITINFTPLAIGNNYTATATVTFYNRDGAGTPHNITLTGSCVPAPAADFDVQNSSGQTVVNSTGVYFGDFYVGEAASTQTLYLVNISDMKVGSTPTVSIAPEGIFTAGAYNAETKSFGITFEATVGMTSVQNAVATFTMLNNDDQPTTKVVPLSAFVVVEPAYAAEVIANDGITILKQGTWAECLEEANKVANAGSTLRLVKNVNLNTDGLTSAQEIKNTFTLDLNGKKLEFSRNGSIIYVNKAGITLTIKDSKSAGSIENIGSFNATATYVFNVTAGNLIIKNGSFTVENTYAGKGAYAILQKAGTNITIDGGTIRAIGKVGVEVVNQASNKNDNTILTINNGELHAEGDNTIYGIDAYGLVNINGGTITAKLNGTANSSNVRGIYLRAAASATASECYHATLTMNGGTVNAINNYDHDNTHYAYGILFDCSNASMGAATATDGSHANKAAAIGTIYNATINASTLGRYSYGILAYGSYNSKTDTYDKIKIYNSTINATSNYYHTYGVYATCGVNATNGGIYAANIELNDCEVNATTTKYHTAYAVWATTTSTTIYQADQPNYYGEYAGGATITVNGGTYTATTGTTTALTIGTSARSKTIYDPLYKANAERRLSGAAEGYATLNINGGTFIANAGTTTARAVSNGGNCTIIGGEFYATTGTTTADGIYNLGRLKATGAKIVSTATTNTAYGVRTDVSDIPAGSQAWTGFTYRGESELNNLDVTVTTGSGSTAYGVYANAKALLYTTANFETQKTSSGWSDATYTVYKAVSRLDQAFADSAYVTVNGGTYNVTAETSTAYGAFSNTTAVAAAKTKSASAVMNLKNAKFVVKTNQTTEARGIYSSGRTTIDGCDITATSKTTTAYGVLVADKKTTITNSKITVTATNSDNTKAANAFGIYGTVDINATHGYKRYADIELNEGNVVTATTTSGTTAYALFLNATKRNIASGDYAGDYAVAAKAVINGGKYTATAAGTTGFALCVAAQQVQGTAVAQPELTVNDGKFKGAASSSYAEINTNGKAGHVVLNGGYYVNSSNLNTYAASDKVVTALANTRTEYSEGYRYEIAPPGGNYVCQIGSTKYKTLEEALSVVTSGQVIYMIADYTLPAGDYILPTGATLLIPYKNGTGKGASTAIGNSAETTTSATTPYLFRKLTFASDANLTCFGTIETSAQQKANGQYGANVGMASGPYGQIQLEEGAHIEMENGSRLNCWGFVTGKGTINVKKGANTLEGFQLGDWCGGTNASNLIGNSQKVFPITHYFFQSIECPITYRPGSTALGSTHITVSVPIIGQQTYGQDNIALVGTSGSMFLMNNEDASANTWVMKDYDEKTDQCVWTLNSGASVGNLKISISSYNMNSANYDLPITTNMSIVMNYGTMSIGQNAVFLPGSKLIVNKEGTLDINGVSVVAYDKDDWTGTTRYYATYSPSWGTTNPRKSIALQDADFFIHGKVNIRNSGGLYTSAAGANVHSTNEDAGEVVYNTKATDNKTSYFLVQGGTNKTQLTVNPAKLKNGDGSYTASAGTFAGKRWIYIDNQWQCWTQDEYCIYRDNEDNPYAKPDGYVALNKQEADVDDASLIHDAATGTHGYIWDADCYWWEVNLTPVGVGIYQTIKEDHNGKLNCYEFNENDWYWEIKNVTVTWNGEGVTTTNYTNVGYGTSPKWLGATPTKSGYVWDGWQINGTGTVYTNDNLPVVTSNTTFTSHFVSNPVKYNITFKNDDGKVLESKNWESGATPSYSGGTPTKDPTASQTFTWNGTWSPAITTVSAAKEYTAQYTANTRQYDVTFLDYNNEELETKKVNYNVAPTYTGDPSTPTREDPTDTYIYEFSGWKNQQTGTTGLAAVKGDQTYVAQYTHHKKWFNIRFVDYNGTTLQTGPVLRNTMPTPPANPTRESDAQYDYSFKAWSPTIVAATENATYTATYNMALRSYTVRFLNYDGTVLQTETLDYGTTPSYKGETPTNADESKEFVGWDDVMRSVDCNKDYTAQYTTKTYTITVTSAGNGSVAGGGVYSHGSVATLTATPEEGFVFDHWNDDNTDNPRSLTVTETATYTATFISDETGSYLDIVDATATTLTINATTLALSNWPYTINGISYGRKAGSGDRQCNEDRTITISHDKAADAQLLITVQDKNSTLMTRRKYTIPHVYESSATLSGVDENSIIFVRAGTLTVNANTTVKNIYVAPGAKLVVNSGKTLTADNIYLRTTPWASAELELEGTISGQVSYTRIIADKSQYFQFGLPQPCAIADVRLSDGSTPVYGNGWLLRSYSESHRATYGAGAGVDNWVTLTNVGVDITIQRCVGYEMFSNSSYYREYYFPVAHTGLVNSVAVSHSSSPISTTEEGWNIVTSPLMRTYTHDPEPEGIAVSWLQEDGSYVQEPVTEIRPAIPFSYQAKGNGYIYFDENMSASAPRRVAAADEPERIQWIHIDVEDANEVGDQTSIYVHPTRYDESYQSGIDVAKQSLTATRAIIYSSHAYGDMAFAGVSDASLEQGVALTVYNPSEQELTFSLRENNWLNRMAYVWLVDTETGAQIDLLESDYNVLVPEGTIRGRFYISGLFKAPQITTDNDVVQSDDEQGTKVEKLLINQKMYIKINGVLYDATGKKVNK